MSCRFSISGRPSVADLITAPEAAELYRDLVTAGRYHDFRWFALSQGVPEERVEELWRYLGPADALRDL
ncbi:MAG: hypothetical protein A3I14_00825 [Candidatus Rokubacteria bacterium RIFCSPLOWO2_02_FULL_73_56]|nr:MAG: hypothetical protein A3D33_03055 [Candidatus Rokubacteria bacterium RIFCSPHIGHO2_02_FULL_73_26]OGL12613.1 MAG: hypothetical protein A3I14_00825 [Candidatus Rokubacteria bacterium RIFCSPLOWO2_02_FULL_73_56]OGL30121.1 MAG: hypothetical protein A3G44_00530 [Candidatus Rokubacteria bacterium RIFCSPLOWO2_12_FULL_73_47]